MVAVAKCGPSVRNTRNTVKEKNGEANNTANNRSHTYPCNIWLIALSNDKSEYPCNKTASDLLVSRDFAPYEDSFEAPLCHTCEVIIESHGISWRLPASPSPYPQRPMVVEGVESLFCSLRNSDQVEYLNMHQLPRTPFVCFFVDNAVVEFWYRRR